MRHRYLILGISAALLGGVGDRHGPDRVLLTQPLPRMNGASLQLTAVEVNYGPGESSPLHRHPCPVVVYIIEGAVRSQVSGGRERVFRAGDAFYEEANRVHQISGNASDREPAKFLATFLCDRDGPLSVPAAR